MVIIVSIFFSCTNDNDDLAVPADFLFGTWKLTASSQNGIDTKLSQCDLKDLIIFGETKLMYVFNKNGSGSKCKIETIKKDYTIKDNIITEDDGIEITIEDKVLAFGPSSIVLKFEEEEDDEIVVYRETYVKELLN